MIERETVGSLAVKAAQDTSKYSALHNGHEATEDIGVELTKCINLHNPKTAEKEYCIGFVYAKDPLIPFGLKRRKFFASLYLPSPRPEQTIFLYSKEKDKVLCRLWSLPDWKRMALLSQLPSVDKEWKQMKEWSDAFYAGSFWHFIRKQHGIDMLSEHEYLNANREKFIEAGCQEIEPGLTDPFDFGKIKIDKIINTKETLTDQ